MDEYDVEKTIQKILDCSESWTPQEKIPFIIEEINNLKEDMRMFLDNCEFDLTAILNESNELSAQSKDLIEEMIACKTEIENETIAEILKSIESHDQIGKEIDQINYSMCIVGEIGQCGRYLKFFEEGREAQSFSRAIDSVCDLLMYIEHPADGFNQLDIYANIKNTGQLILDNLLHDLYQEWTRMLSYNISTKNHKPVITLNIKLDDSNRTFDIINALDISKKLDEKIAEFADFLKQEVFKAILHNDCIVYAESDEIATITVTSCKQNYRPPYSNTIANMRILFHFLNNKFTMKFKSDETIMKILGRLICAEYCELMINECFIHTIPNNINDLHTYARIKCEIQEFQYFLIIIKIFPDEGLSLLKYMDNIDVLFANCSSQHYLKTARSIMLKDLGVTMSIGVEKIPETTLESKNNSIETNVAEALDIFQKTIPKSLYYFPRCLISKTAQELLDLVHTIMEQAVQCSDVVCKKLYSTVRFIFELYDAVVPYYHEKYLETIPQYVALFHNNCMYLAHNLQTLGDKWLSLMEGRKLDYAVGFVDLVQKIRELGYTHLTMHMQQQRKQILDNIRSSDLNCIVVKDVLGENAETAVRQCIRQLQLLKNVWIGVYPPNVFTKLMSTLVNMFIEELIHRVCTAEDISMDIATQLTDMYTMVVQKSPKFFIDTSDVENYVKSWVKLQVLIIVLGGSLKDIENHWSDGTGPLATHFEVEEIRSLIKALFQNTQFRANLLSKIK